MIVYQPFDRAAIAELPEDHANSIEQKIARAAQAFENRSQWLPAFQRIEILNRLASLVQRESDHFAMLIAREGGKPLKDAQAEVARAINGIEIAVAEMYHLAGEEIPMGLTAASQGRWAFTTREPIGVVVAISAFNHPLNLIIHQVIPAIAVGCPVLVKPAPVTPLSCLRLVELIHEAGLPESWCQAINTSDNALAEKLATDPRIAFLTFIGSAKVGWYLRSKLPPGTRVSLEHGGAAPVIVDQAVDLATLMEPLAKGGYYHAGQVCVSTQRIFVHEANKADFIEHFAERVNRLAVGDPTLIGTEVGPLILPREVDRVETWVTDAIAAGARAACGGARLGETLFQPTVLVDPPATASVSQLEIFGPVTCIYGYSELAEAIQRANSLPFAFQSSIFTRDINAALTSARLLNASTVLINDHTAFRTDWMPFAGRLNSGYGTGGIPFTMRDFTEAKMIVLSRG